LFFSFILLAPAAAFDLRRRPKAGFRLVSVKDGRPDENLY
jgi:hypothetical protein